MFWKKNEGNEFYTFKDKYVRGFIRRSMKGGKVSAVNRYFESNQCQERLNTIEKPFKVNDIKISNIMDEILK